LFIQHKDLKIENVLVFEDKDLSKS